MNNEIPVPPSLRGIDESASFDGQPPNSTRDSKNTRSVNDSNDREQLNVRSGTAKHVSTQLGNAPVKVATQITYDAKNLTYTAAASPSDSWTFVPRTKGDVLATVADKQGNVFHIDGKGQVSKVNADGRHLWTSLLPIDDNDLLCRALAVDDVGNVYAATSAKGSYQGGVATPTNGGALWPLYFTGATWTDATKRLTFASSILTNYTFATGDEVRITSGTGAAPGTYVVGAKNAADKADLITSIGAAANAQTDIAGMLLAGAGLTGHKQLGDASASRIWKLRQVYSDKSGDDPCDGVKPPDVILESAWTIDTKGALVEQMQVFGGRLFTVQNNPQTAQSWIVVYDNIGTAVPDEVMRTKEDVCPFPTNGVGVKDGAIFTTHEPNLHRGEVPNQPNYTKRTTDWTPNDLKDSKKRIHSWYKAEDIRNAAGEPLKDGDDVLVWQDSSGNGRHLYASAGKWNGYTIVPPKYRANGIGGKPSVYFQGKKTVTPLGGIAESTVSMLQSGVNATDDPSQKTQQLTICPGYKDSRWALFMVVRPTVQDAGQFEGGTIWYQYNNASTAGQNVAGYMICSNSAPTTATTFTVGNINTTAHRIGIVDASTGTVNEGGNAPNGVQTGTAFALPYAANIYSAPKGVTNVPGAGVIAYLNNGGHSGTQSLFYWNGNPIDRWKSKPWRTVDDGTQFAGASVLGLSPKNATYGAYDGETSEIIAFDDYDASPVTGSNVRILTHPAYPDVILSAATIDLEFERVNSYLMHRHGLAHLIPTNEEKGVGDGTGPSPGDGSSTTVTASNAAWTAASRTITKTGAFVNYRADGHAVAGDYVTVLGGTDATTGGPVTLGVYSIASATDNTIVLTVGQSIAANDATGVIVNVHYHNISGSHPLYPNPVQSNLVGPPRLGGLTTASKFADLNHFDSLLVKWESAKGDPKWSVKASSTIGGIGYGVVVDCTGHPVTIGPRATTSPNEFIRRTLDNGDTATTTASNTAWYLASASGVASAAADASGGNVDYRWPRMAADKFDTIYVPVFDTNPAAASRSSLLVLHRAEAGNVADILLEYDASTSGSVHVAHSVAIDLALPDYEKATVSNDIFDASTAYAAKAPRAEFVYLGLRTITQGDALLRKVKIVDSTPGAGTQRRFKYLAAVAGNIVTFVAPSTVATPTGGSSAFSSSSQFISAAAFLGEAFFTDGRARKVYSPKTGLVTDWTSKTAGKIPPRCKLLVQWNGRLVLGRDADNPSALHFSARRDAYDWDRFPGVSIIPGQAFSLTDPTRGAPNDIINCILPWTADRLLALCDRSVWVVDGDPTYGGGSYQIPSSWGASFGRSAAVDEQGTVYFFTSTGGVAYLSGGLVRSLTEGRIERRMQALAFDSNHVQLAWDDVRKRLHVFQEPYGAGGTSLAHWSWERRTNSWREDEFGTASVQPSFAAMFDGDAQGDRRLLLFTQGGYCNKYDPTVDTDDGNAFFAHEVIGPLAPKMSQRWRFTHPRLVFDHSLGAPTVEMITAEAPSLLGQQFNLERLEPGTNGYGSKVMCGAYGFLRLSGTTRWAYEEGTIRAHPAGRQRA